MAEKCGWVCSLVRLNMGEYFQPERESGYDLEASGIVTGKKLHEMNSMKKGHRGSYWGAGSEIYTRGPRG